ncbi:hypothetical protein ACM46_10165 [Chryseobacterium angstadtii]|uniref:Uncharacterized protein n=1 Tax=Chryseobacterium angstadtii TaxID=558151 RepID=A0A0J7IFB6_9FLAO|nr:hypothetical protein ACM46_10165 [Chryseobacterium angstadtii]
MSFTQERYVSYTKYRFEQKIKPKPTGSKFDISIAKVIIKGIYPKKGIGNLLLNSSVLVYLSAVICYLKILKVYRPDTILKVNTQQKTSCKNRFLTA